MKTISLSLLLAAITLVMASCGPRNKTAAMVETPIMNAFDATPKTGSMYGAGVSPKADVMSYAELMRQLDGKESVTGVVEGEVTDVCQKKGCWMTLQPTKNTSPVSVRFKDYSFFMPKTLAGNKVIVEGTATKKMVSVEDLRHYAEDAGKSAAEIAAITEPRAEIELMATGVRVL